MSVKFMYSKSIEYYFLIYLYDIFFLSFKICVIIYTDMAGPGPVFFYDIKI